MSTVLYINGKLGVWMHFERNTCVSVYAEDLRIGQAGYKPCEWLKSKQHLVHLVIDSEHTEIDAYPLQPNGSLMHQRSHRKALRRTLIDRFPNAIIQTPKKHTGLDALLVQKVNLSEISRLWLAYVEQSNVTFRSVATSAETVAHLFRGSDQPYLVLSNVLGYCKHTFCVSGHALFTRTLEYSEMLSIVDGLKETLSHLRMTELIDTPVRIYLVGLTVQQLKEASGLEWVGDIVKCDEPAFSDVSGKHKLNDKNVQYGAVIQIAQHVLRQKVLRQHCSIRYVSMLLTKHLKLIKHRCTLVQLAALTALTVCTAVYSGLMMFDRHKTRSEYVHAKAALSLAVDDAKQAVFDENADGVVLSYALFNVEALKSSSGPSPLMLLPMIATVFTEHRELVLQELSWVTVDNTISEDAEFYTPATERITSRNQISIEPKRVSKLLVNVMGNSNSAATLREQQSALGAVIAMLEQYSSISHLVVLEAPLANATNNDRIGADALDLATDFQIQFQVNRSSTNEI